MLPLIVLLGVSGSGKSTLPNYRAGDLLTDGASRVGG